MNRRFQPGDEIRGAVVVQRAEREPIVVTLRCECDATFGILEWRLNWARGAKTKLLCPGCRTKPEPGPTTAEIMAEVVRLKTKENMRYQDICKALDLGHSRVYYLLKKAGVVEPR